MRPGVRAPPRSIESQARPISLIREADRRVVARESWPKLAD